MKGHTHIGPLPDSIIRVVLENVAGTVSPDFPPIKSGVVLAFTRQGGGDLRLALPMADALMLLNALRELEQVYGLDEWAKKIGTDKKQFDCAWAEIQRL